MDVPEGPGSDPAEADALGALEQYRAKSRRSAAKMRRTARDYLDGGRPDLHNQIMLGIDIEHMPSHIVRELRDRIPVGSSFSAAMATTNAFVRAARNTDVRGYLRITSKEDGQLLADSLGLQVARKYQERVPLQDVVARRDCVIKPVASSGSRGVLLCRKRQGFTLVRDGTRFESLADYQREMRSWLNSRQLRHDSWIVEELLTGRDGEPAHDLKFYTFYGRVGLVLECRRLPETRFCFYDSDGRRVDTGKYSGKAFVGEGFKPAWLTEMAQVSRRVPLPFLRIDMYKTRRGLYFGEFTTVPGKYQEFNLAYDRMLGELWNQARADIFADLLGGKAFPEFTRFLYCE